MTITLFILNNGKGDPNKIIDSISKYLSIKTIVNVNNYEEINWHNKETEWYAVFESSEDIPEELSAAFPSFLYAKHDMLVLFKKGKEFAEFKPRIFKSRVMLCADGSPNEFGGCLTFLRVLNGFVEEQTC